MSWAFSYFTDEKAALGSCPELFVPTIQFVLLIKTDTDAPKPQLHKLCDTNQINTSMTGCTSHPSQGSQGDLGLSCCLQTTKDCRGSQAVEIQWGRCLLSLPPHPLLHSDKRRMCQGPRVIFYLWQINSLQPLPPHLWEAMLRITTSPEIWPRGSNTTEREQRFRPFVRLFCGFQLHSHTAKGPLVLAQYFSAYSESQALPQEKTLCTGMQCSPLPPCAEHLSLTHSYQNTQ